MTEPWYTRVAGVSRLTRNVGVDLDAEITKQMILVLDPRNDCWMFVQNLYYKAVSVFECYVATYPELSFRSVRCCNLQIEASNYQPDEARMRALPEGSAQYLRRQRLFYQGVRNHANIETDVVEVLTRERCIALLRRMPANFKHSPAHIKKLRAILQRGLVFGPIEIQENVRNEIFKGGDFLKAVQDEGYPPVSIRYSRGWSVACYTVEGTIDKAKSARKQLQQMNGTDQQQSDVAVAKFIIRYVTATNTSTERGILALEAKDEMEAHDRAYAVARGILPATDFTGARGAIVTLANAFGARIHDLVAAIVAVPPEGVEPVQDAAWKLRTWYTMAKGKVGGGQTSQLMVFRLTMQCGLEWLSGNVRRFTESDFSLCQNGEMRGLHTKEEVMDRMEELQAQGRRNPAYRYQPLPAVYYPDIELVPLPILRPRGRGPAAALPNISSGPAAPAAPAAPTRRRRAVHA